MPNLHRFAEIKAVPYSRRANLCVAVTCFAAAAWAIPAVAQDGPEKAAASELTGLSAREWLSGEVRTWMGADGPCGAGQAYRFSVDGTARIEECVNGHRQARPLSWSVWAQGPLDVLIGLDGKTYYLLFTKAGGRQHMILRRRGDSKVDPIEDHDFILSDD